MAHAERCPVCGDEGRKILVPDPMSTAVVGRTITCHGCAGLGWVTVQDEQPFYLTPYWPVAEDEGTTITVTLGDKAEET